MPKGQFNHKEVIDLNKRLCKNILFFTLTVACFIYEFYTLIPNSVIYIDGNKSSLPQYVSRTNEAVGDKEKIRLFGIIPYKSVEVDTIKNDMVIPGGSCIGIDINVDGVLIIGFSDFYGIDGKKHCPAKSSGLLEQDIITHMNGVEISSANQFARLIDENGGNSINVVFCRNNIKMSTNITPIKSAEDGIYHIGLWARDGTSGIGTLTFVNPKTQKFGALGHGITDADTDELIVNGRGSIYNSSVIDIKKGERGFAGELMGQFSSDKIGAVESNSEFGVFGEYYGNVNNSKAVEIASRNEIRTGEASVLCCTDGSRVGEYKINIDHIFISSFDNKSMIIRITDDRLVTKTGGIVQGMSGSPIIQNGKLIGAVTHVFVNDPTRGYAIFIENMLSESEKIG